MIVRSWRLWQCPPRRVCQGMREDPVMIPNAVTIVSIGQYVALVKQWTIVTNVLDHALTCWRLIQLKQELC